MSVIITVFSVMLVALPLPEVGMTPPEAVPYSTIEQLVSRKAAAEWPGARMGAVVPYVDEDGRTVAYSFQFRTDGKPFPAYDQVADDIMAERRSLGPNTDLSSRTSDYAFVLASARYDRAPILAYGHGVSAYYAVGRAAAARAVERLGPDAVLTRMYFQWPRVRFEFSVGHRRVVMTSRFERTWDSRAAYADEVRAQRERAIAEFGHDADAIARVHNAEWDEALVCDFTDFGEVYVADKERAPFYDWSYGCTPTAAAMVCGYIDRTLDYGRTVDWYWHRYDMVEGQMDWQIPNVQRECAVAMHTDTTTGGTTIFWIGTGLRTVFQDNGYICDMIVVQGGVGNDWAWSTVTSEIDAGYSMVWSALWERHSLAAYGYRTPQKDVYVHNTWWQPAAWWHYSGDDWSHVASPHPSGGDAHKLEVTYPLGDTNYSSIGGGEILQVGDTAHVTWDNFGNPGTKVDIDISLNGGLTWTGLVNNQPDNGAYDWYIAPTTPANDSVRLRFKQYNGGTYTSGDGTFGCFSVLREPRPPLSLAPPNGRQLFDPPVILLVDSARTDVDSFDFRVIRGGDTIWREASVMPKCSLPDTLFVYGRSYKWVCRGHNQFGWGEFGTPWSFWCRFNSGVAEETGISVDGFHVTPVNRRGAGVSFQVGRTVAGGVLVIYDALGVRVRVLSPAPVVVWDGRDQAGWVANAGLYFARLECDDRTVTARFLLME